MEALVHLYPRLSPGGYCIVDDYHDIPQCGLAVNDYRRQQGITDAGYAKLVASAPGHVACVRQLVIDEFSPAELARLAAAAERIMARVDASSWRQELG